MLTPSNPKPKRKRDDSNDGAPKAKHQGKADAKTKKSVKTPGIPKQYVYLATETEHYKYTDEEHVFEIYTSLEDANRRLIARTSDPESDISIYENQDEWSRGYDEHGCFHAEVENGGGDGFEFRVQRMEVKPPGSVPPVPKHVNTQG